MTNVSNSTSAAKRKSANTFEMALRSCQEPMIAREIIAHLGFDQVVLDELVESAIRDTKPSHEALLTSTVDSPNRERDRRLVQKHIGLPEEGNDETILMSGTTRTAGTHYQPDIRGSYTETTARTSNWTKNMLTSKCFLRSKSKVGSHTTTNEERRMTQ